jgi:2-keto-4-pentenoate hydratase/2-oxohepta-3-ene-1,7-dioic acid hydratase in catechol pathway
MRLFSYDNQGRAAIGVVKSTDATEFVDLGAAGAAHADDMTALLAAPGALAAAKTAADRAGANAVRPLARIKYLPVVPRPSKILCLGLNYAEHAKEGGHARPEYPSIFMRGATSLIGHGQPIVRPRVSDKLDYEAELALIVGKPARHLTRANALDCLAGYTCFNDASIRDYQRKTNQWTIGKNFDGTGPFGPWLVTPDELPAGCAGLRIQSRLNGRIMQDANTHDLLWDVVETLVLITECLTLEPGDVIITGTPAGVGYARNPPVFMAPGDSCEVEIEGVGILSNPIADEAG